jgi:hypothetical protein
LPVGPQQTWKILIFIYQKKKKPTVAVYLLGAYVENNSLRQKLSSEIAWLKGFEHFKF